MNTKKKAVPAGTAFNYLLRRLVRWSAYILLSAMRLSDSCMKCLSLSSKLASFVGPLARGTL